MEMKKYIEMGEKKAGKQVELARILNVRDSTLRLAKTGHSGLPDAICFLLADYIEVDAASVIAASNLVTEKNEERRRIFEGYLKKNTRAVANWVIAAIVISFLTLSPLKPAQAQASNIQKCILC